MMKQLTLKSLLAALLACCGGALCAGVAAAGGQGQRGAPPDVVITSPDESAAPVDHESLTVRLAVLSYDIPLAGVVVTLNGEKVFSKSYDSPQGRDRLEFTVKLRPGANELAATATNKFGPSRPAVRRLSFAPPSQAGDSNLYVLAVGVGKYGSDQLRLNFPESDARAVAAAFERMRGRRPVRNIQTRVLPNEQATKEAILEGLVWLNEGAGGERDLRMVFVAGRTARVGGASYFLSPRAESPAGSPDTDLRLGLIWEALSSRPGAALVLGDIALSDFRPSTSGAKAASQDARSGPYVLNGTVSSFLAAVGNEVPQEELKWKHSAFTTALLEGLGKADSDGGCVELDELAEWLVDSVGRLTVRRQNVFVLLNKKHEEIRLTCPNG